MGPDDERGARFAADLRALALAAGGPSYRELSRRVERRTGRFYSKTTIGDVLAGERLPRLDLLVDLVTELGGDARAWRERLLAPEPATGPAPAAVAQMPHDIRDFTGRDTEVATLRGWLAAAPGTGMPVVLVEGMAGTGKTRLAVRVAHLEAARFDEVQLYADLHGFSAGRPPADPAAVLESFLRQLGVPAAAVPVGTEDRAALFRARLAGRRALVVLDNAAGADQVRPLLPGSPTCAVLVTSRRSLNGLDGESLTLGVLTEADALALLDRVVGVRRTAAEPDRAARIVALCGRLPLAVVLAARRLRSRPVWRLADLADRLSAGESRLTELAASDLAVRVAFDVSYDHLDDEHRRCFRLLALHPGPDLGPHAAAALTDRPVPAATRLLEDLLDEHLLEQTEPDRYRLHDLLHVFARERVEREDDPAGRAAAVLRVVGWYLRTADAASAHLAPHRRPLPYDPGRWPGVPLPPLDRYEDALRWCDAERPALPAAVALAVDAGHDDVAWQLAIGYFSARDVRHRWPDWTGMLELGLAAARRLGDEAAIAWTANALGIVHVEAGDSAAAEEHLTASLEARARLGDEVGLAQVYNNLGECYRRQGQPARAIRLYRRDLAICRRRGDRQGEAVSLDNLGKAELDLGRPAEALRSLVAALAAARSVGDRVCEAEVHGDLAAARRATGDRAGAAADLRRCAELHGLLGNPEGAAAALVDSAELAAAGGDRAAAGRYARAAERWLAEVAEPVAGDLRSRLAAVARPGRTA